MADYHRPETLQEALTILAETRATVAAGCTDLFPATGARALQGSVLDLTGIAGLQGVSTIPDGVRIGGATSWAAILRADLPSAFGMLKDAAREVGSVQIQTTGTVAGNLCNASPAADGVPCLLALDARVELTSVRGTRRLALAEFITGPRQTARQADEIVTAILIPSEATTGRSRFVKLGARKYLVISIAMVAARLAVADGRVTAAALAVGACSAVATRLPALEQALIGQRADAGLADFVTEAHVLPHLAPIDDIRADAAYRGRAATELLRRALADLTAGSAEVAA